MFFASADFNFNSALVRLIAKIVTHAAVDEIKFQFRFGSINSRYCKPIVV